MSKPDLTEAQILDSLNPSIDNYINAYNEGLVSKQCLLRKVASKKWFSDPVVLRKLAQANVLTR